MFMIQCQSNSYKLPANITESNEVLRYICSILHVDDKEFILSFNNIFLSTYFNYKLLEIGYNPYEILELTKINKKKAVFKVLNFDHFFYLNSNQFTSVFSTKEHFAELFYTIPQNIVIKYRNTKLLDSVKIINYETDRNESFQITVDENYFLVRTYLHEPHFTCMPLNSTVKNLKNTISVYSQKVHRTIEADCEYSDKLIEMCKQNDIEKEESIDSSELQNLSTLIPLFEFTESNYKNSEVYTITVNIKDDGFNIFLVRNYQSSCAINLYSLTVLIEKDLGIDRGLFKPFDKNDSPIQLDVNVTPENNTFFFRIFNHLHVKIDDSIQEMSYLTTIKDIQKLNCFECHNFGIIINDHFAYHDDNGKFMLVHFMNEIKNSENPTKLLIKKSLEPCYQASFIKEKEEGDKRATKNFFIIPNKMKLEEITKNYLHLNFESIKIFNRNKEEIIYSNSEEQKIHYTLIDKSKKKHEKSIKLIGQNPRVIDLLQAIYNEKNSKTIPIFNMKINKVITKYDIIVPLLNDKKLNFWEHLSTVFTDEHNPITIKGDEEQKDVYILCLLNNCFSTEKVQFKSRLCANEIIDNYCKSKGIATKNLKIYADFNELAPSDIPSLFKLKKPFLIINQETEKKTLVIKNASNFKFEYTIQKANYSNLAYLISTMFMMNEDDLTFTASFDHKDYTLPSRFDAGSFPERCEILVHYEYEKKCQMAFLYENETKTINIDVDEPIEQIIPIIQSEFNIWHLSKSSIYLSLFNFSFVSSQSFASYKLPENVVINVCKKVSSYPIKISTPENPEFEDFYFVKGDKIENVIEHFETKFGRDIILYKNMERTILMKIKTKLNKDMKLYLSCEPISLKCEGSIGDDEIEVSEILTVKETAKYLTEKMKSNVYIFTKNDQNNCYEAVDEEKKLYEIESDIFVHQTFSKVEFNFPIFNGDEHISEMNTIGWLKENFISKYLLLNPEDFVIMNESRKVLGDSDKIKNGFTKSNEKFQIEIGKGIARRKSQKIYFSTKKYRPATSPTDCNTDFPKSEPPKKKLSKLKINDIDSPKSEKKSKKSPTLKNKKKNSFTEGTDDGEIQPKSSDEIESPKLDKKSSDHKNKSKKVDSKEIEDEKLKPKSKTSKKSPNHKNKKKNSNTEEIEKEESKPKSPTKTPKKSSIESDKNESPTKTPKKSPIEGDSFSSPKTSKKSPSFKEFDDDDESATPKSDKSSKKSSKHKKKKNASSEGIENEKSSPSPSKNSKKTHNPKQTETEDNKKIESPTSSKKQSKHKKKAKISSTDDIEDDAPSPTPKSEPPKVTKAHRKSLILKNINDDKETKSQKSKLKKRKSLAVINKTHMIISDEEKGEQKSDKNNFETPKHKKHYSEEEEEQNSESKSPKNKKNSLKKKSRSISDDEESKLHTLKSAKEPKKNIDDVKSTDQIDGESSNIKKKLRSVSDDEEIDLDKEKEPNHKKINKDKEPSPDSLNARKTSKKSSDIKNKSPISSDDDKIDSKSNKESSTIKKKLRSASDDDDEPESDSSKTEKASKRKVEDVSKESESSKPSKATKKSSTIKKKLRSASDDDDEPESDSLKIEKTSKKKKEEESKDPELLNPSKTTKESSSLKKKLRSASNDDDEPKSPSDTKMKLLIISDDDEPESDSSKAEKASKKKNEEESKYPYSESSNPSKITKESSSLKKKLQSVSDDDDAVKTSKKKGEDEESYTDSESKSSSDKMKLLIVSDDEEIESSEKSSKNADDIEFSSESEKIDNDKQEINDETKSSNIEEESSSDEMPIDFSKASTNVRKFYNTQKKKTEKNSDKNIESKIASPKDKDDKDNDSKEENEIQKDKKEDKNEKETKEESNEIKEIIHKEEEEEDEEEESEEDIFKKTAKNIFRFLSVSFFDNLHKKRIGRGATSIVYKIHHIKYPNKFFALKIIDLDLFNEYDESDDENKESENSDNEDEPPKLDVDKMRRFYLEYEVLNKLDHPNIVKTYGMFQGDENHAPAILLEYCPKNLKKDIKKFSNEERIEIIFKLSSAMQKIHELGIIHRDLKPENILIGVDKQIKVSDFGLCTFIEIDNETISRTQFAGTMRFMAPELINEQKDYNEKVDVYSFGVVVYWILMKGEYPSIKLVEVANGKQAKIPNTISDFSIELIRRCWSVDPKDRPSFNEICEILETRRNELIK